LGRGLDWVTPRGPFQPWTCWDSVILYGGNLPAPRTRHPATRQPPSKPWNQPKTSVLFSTLNHSGLKTAAGFSGRETAFPRGFGVRKRSGSPWCFVPRPAASRVHSKDVLRSCKPLLLIKPILHLICRGCSEELRKLNCFPLHYEEESRRSNEVSFYSGK